MNAILGVTRPGDFGVDIMHYQRAQDLQQARTAAAAPAPARSRSASAGAVPAGAVVVEKGEDGFKLDYDRPQSIGRVRSFFGNVGMLVRAYCYIRTLGAEGLREVSESAVLNANYLLARLREGLRRAVRRPLHARVRRLGRAR